ncbi:MAG: DNA-3-methyladenine glycosylase [Ignavibacteria bacterium]|nr:DNA-3-methyladenine glycosylase [Ignavibacteria bacterium]
MKREFFLQPPEIAARELIGCVLTHIASEDDTRSVRLTETEAYLAEDDEACHAHKGLTPRTAPMFERGGILYVYFIYGKHWCANIVTEPRGRASAVLLRSGIAGDIEIGGPGRLATFLGIDKTHNYTSVLGGQFDVFEDELTPLFRAKTVVTKRIGIRKSVDLPLRFVVAGHLSKI